ncbi:hypothetical protein KHQ06_24700 [Nocardia tengchongensis]|uniref:Uncharacterized protein n=1 Tax=Nocardia tengchongensis TaxID=2055889 RepID=A0ABX8CM22_9NOCA|nr:hypothetical protein [Nocardia tengchongensis]QVI19560.1 hypothetical protein KHQ06_24700 [Nocardia tengchongensis]
MFCQERRIVLHGNNLLTGEQENQVAPEPTDDGEPAPDCLGAANLAISLWPTPFCAQIRQDDLSNLRLLCTVELQA